MKSRNVMIVAGSTVAALSFGFGLLIAQTPAESQQPATPQSHEIIGKMHMSHEQCREMMKKMGMSEAMMTRCQIMGNARISAYDPAAVLAVRHELKLTDEQVKALETIAAATQEQVKLKLSAEQLAALQPVSATPESMADCCKAMHDKTGKPMKGMMMCPMMPMSAPGDAKGSQDGGMSCCPMMEP